MGPDDHQAVTRGIKAVDGLAGAVQNGLVSPTVRDTEGNPANVVDVIHSLSESVGSMADAVTPRHAAMGTDEQGNAVGSLTEAVMSVATGLHRIADAIEMLNTK